jgi:pimeloyl-ACP methyl ester carboxylesterase
MKNVVYLFLLISINSFGQEESPGNFKKSTVKIEKVKIDIYKGAIPVKLDHSDSSSATIYIPVHIFKSSSKTPAEPIYIMGGGPGESNLCFIPPKEYLANHDFVEVGYRGVDGPVWKKAKKYIKALRGLDHHLFSDKSLDNMATALKEYFAEAAKEGIDINHFTIIDVIDDFEDVRKHLGHQKINLFSESMGTRIALLYSYCYPNSIKRSLMVGVGGPGHFIWHPEATARIIHNYDSIYKTQYGANDISIEESIRVSFKKMPKRWSFFKLDTDKIKTSTFFVMYSKESAVMAFDAYRRAATKGDYSGLYFMQLAFDYINFFKPGGATNYGDFTKTYSADYVPGIDYRKSFSTDSLEIGAPTTILFWGMNVDNLVKPIAEEYRTVRPCNIETLMIGGNLDISCPPESTTKELLPYMENGKQVILKDMAHVGDLEYAQHDAFNFMFTKYFNDGVVDTSQFKHIPINFQPKMSYNKMAKWLYPVVLIMSLLK